MLQVSKGGKRKYQSLGISILPRYWDFTRNKPKPNCPNREYIQKIILDKQRELQQRMLEFNTDQKNIQNLLSLLFCIAISFCLTCSFTCRICWFTFLLFNHNPYITDATNSR